MHYWGCSTDLHLAFAWLPLPVCSVTGVYALGCELEARADIVVNRDATAGKVTLFNMGTTGPGMVIDNRWSPPFPIFF